MARSRREKEISEELSAEKKSAVAATLGDQNVKCKNQKKGTNQMKTKNTMERCPMTLPDCAARTAYGLCECLNSVDYSDARPCPFYKPRDQNATENARALERLRNTGRSALLEKYHSTEAEGESE